MQSGQGSKQAMILGSRFLVLSLCFTAGRAAPILYKPDSRTCFSETHSDQGLQYMLGLPQGLERKTMLWLLSFMGFYGLVWLLDDFPTEPCPVWKGTEVMDDKAALAQKPRHGCSVRSILKSLGQVELNLAVLLYQLRKHKEALSSGCLSDDQDTGLAEDDLFKDLVIYTIEDEP